MPGPSAVVPVAVAAAAPSASAVAALEPLLAADDLERARRFRHPNDAGRFILGRAMLRSLIAEQLDVSPAEVALAAEAGRRPRLVRPDDRELRFSVTHSGDRVLVALARDCDVGVDVEPLRPFPEALRLSRRFFHPDEHAVLTRLGGRARSDAFFRLWVRKEAFLKARGVGLAGSLATACFLPAVADPTAAFPCADDEGGTWSVVDVPIDGRYAAAVAARAGRVEVSVRPWRAPRSADEGGGSGPL